MRLIFDSLLVLMYLGVLGNILCSTLQLETKIDLLIVNVEEVVMEEHVVMFANALIQNSMVSDDEANVLHCVRRLLCIAPFQGETNPSSVYFKVWNSVLA